MNRPEIDQKMNALTLVGLGYGLEFNAEIAPFNYSRVGQGMLRVFVGDDEKGVVISTSIAPNLSGSVQAHIVQGGELRWYWSGSAGSEVLDLVRNEMARIRQLCHQSWRALIPVNSAGPVVGSALARKVKIKLADGRVLTRTVPNSQVAQLDKKLWIPRWLAIEKAGNEEFLGESRLPESLTIAFDQMKEEFERQVLLLSAAARPFQEAERLEAPLREARQKAELVAAQQKAALQREVEIAKEQERQRRLSESKAKRDATVEAIHGATVTWFINVGSLKKPRFVFLSEENCTVRMRGSFVYITLPDGEELRRQPQTVEVVVDGKQLTSGDSLRKNREWMAKREKS